MQTIIPIIVSWILAIAYLIVGNKQKRIVYNDKLYKFFVKQRKVILYYIDVALWIAYVSFPAFLRMFCPVLEFETVVNIIAFILIVAISFFLLKCLQLIDIAMKNK